MMKIVKEKKKQLEMRFPHHEMEQKNKKEQGGVKQQQQDHSLDKNISEDDDELLFGSLHQRSLEIVKPLHSLHHLLVHCDDETFESNEVTPL